MDPPEPVPQPVPVDGDEIAWAQLKYIQDSTPEPPAKLPVFVFSKPTVTVGRLKTCDISLTMPVISGRHCSLSYKNKKMVLKDTSTNGTFVNGELVGKNKLRTLKHGDRVRFGKSTKQNHSQGGAEICVPEYLLMKASVRESLSPADASESPEEVSFISNSSSTVGRIDKTTEVRSAGKRSALEPSENANLFSGEKRRKLEDSMASSPGSGDNGLTGIRGSNRKLLNSNEQLRQQLSEQTNKVSELEKDILALKSQLEDAKKQTETTATETSEQKALAEKETAALKTVIMDLKSELADAKKHAESVATKAGEQKAIAEKATAALENTIMDLKRELADVKEEAERVALEANEQKLVAEKDTAALKESLAEAQKTVAATAQIQQKLTSANDDLVQQREMVQALQAELIDANAKRNNTVQQWNSAKEQLHIEHGRLNDAFRSLEKASETFQKGISFVHAAQQCVEPSQGISSTPGEESSSPLRRASQQTETIAPTQEEEGEGDVTVDRVETLFGEVNELLDEEDEEDDCDVGDEDEEDEASRDQF